MQHLWQKIIGDKIANKKWGDKPANQIVPFRVWSEDKKHGEGFGFTKLERACIDLKVPHPDLAPVLRELILESRKLDYLFR